VFTKLNCNIILDFLEDKHAKIDLGLHTLYLYDGLTVCPLSQPQHDNCFLARTISRVDTKYDVTVEFGVHMKCLVNC
jgi:hypothetical protein